MDLYDGNLFWPTTYKHNPYKKLSKDLQTDITIVGGGMSGILCAYFLSKAGYKVVLIEKNTIASGSSSANTGLLQYSSDISLSKLSKNIGEEDAYLFYKMCFEAMDDFRKLDKDILSESDFFSRDSIYIASDEDDVQDLKAEYTMLEKYNFPVKCINKEELKKQYNIDAPLALITASDAEINPYKFIHVLAKAASNNLVIFEQTEATDLKFEEDRALVICDKYQIKSNYVVLTPGYQGSQYEAITKDKLNTTYAIATNKLDKLLWNDKSMIWESARPYLYARLTKDNRIIAGGLDEKTSKISHDKDYIFKKGQKILEDLKTVIPSIDAKVEYSWHAVFGESTDDLPFIGQDPNEEKLYFCLGFGGNGTVYSMAGAKIIVDLIKNKSNPYAHLTKIKR